MSQNTMLPVGRWWTEVSDATQQSVKNYISILCQRNLIHPTNKAGFVQDVCLRVLSGEEGDGEINQNTIADISANYGYASSQILIVLKHLFDQFLQPVSIKEAAVLMNIPSKKIDSIRALCRDQILTAHKNSAGHWRITPQSIVDHMVPNRLL